MIGFTETGLTAQQTPGLLVSRPPCRSEYPPPAVPVPRPTQRLHLHLCPAPASRAGSGRVPHAPGSEVVRAALSVVPSFPPYFLLYDRQWLVVSLQPNMLSSLL